MEASHISPPPTGAVQWAKAALRRLALAKIEPTPENYARAYAAESGQALAALPEAARPVLTQLATRTGLDAAERDALLGALMAGCWDSVARQLQHAGHVAHAGERPAAQIWAELLQRLQSGLDRGSRVWTLARRKDSLQRVLAVGGGDLARLQTRLGRLLAAWESEAQAQPGDAGDSTVAALLAEAPAEPAAAAAEHTDQALALVLALQTALRASLPEGEPRAAALAADLAALADELRASGVTLALARRCEEACQRARRLLAQRHHVFDELGRLCTALTEGLIELAEDDSWARGQCQAMNAHLVDGMSLRNVRAASDILARSRARQGKVRAERNLARQELKSLIQGMLSELDAFGEHTGRFHDNVGRHAQAIANADSLDSLAGVVREMVNDSREVQQLVRQTQTRLQAEQARVNEMQCKVQSLESELRRLSDEVSTDALTQVANRRGLHQAFELETLRLRRGAAEGATCGLAVGLIDIDNFKKLNDSLGHAAGDVALQSLAARVREQLRPQDTVARFGGEEFVVLLPDTLPEEAQSVLTRLQRQLTASLFMHDQQEVFVTFSGGVTALREGETLEAALERADEALYEAKRTGKNRTCLA